MKRLARCALAASLAFVLTAATAPPPVVAPVVTVAPIVVTPSLPTPIVTAPISSPDPRPMMVYVAPTPAPTPVAVPTVADAKAYALKQLGRTQFACLNDIVQHESKWDPQATNRRSGAFGIPQAWPATKMASAGADWRWNPVTQVKWMLWYVTTKYGSACGAAHYRDTHGIY